MVMFSITIEIHAPDDVPAAWEALDAAGFQPFGSSLRLSREEEPSRGGPIFVVVGAETAEAADSRVREALAGLSSDAFRLGPAIY
jgi:hypothetical protein